MAGTHGWFKAWVWDSGASVMRELERFYIHKMGGDLLGIGQIHLDVELSESDTTLDALMVKGAIIRITDRNTTDGKTPVSGTYFWYQDYVIREPVDRMGTQYLGYELYGYQDGYDLQDTILSGEDESSALEAAHTIFSRYCADAGVTVGVKDTTGNAAKSIKYRYRDDRFLDKIWDLAAVVGCFVQVRRDRANPATRVVDFLNPGSSLAVRPDGTTGWKTTDPIAAADTERILEFFEDIRDFEQIDEVEAEAGSVITHGKGTGGTQNRGTASGAGRAVVLQDLAIFDDTTAGVAATTHQAASPPKRAMAELMVPKLWVSGGFNAILGDTIAVRDSTTVQLATPFQGRYIRWEYHGSQDKIFLYFNRNRFYDAEIMRRSARGLEQLIKYGQGAQQVHGHVQVADVTTGGSGDLGLAFKIPTDFKRLKSAEVILQAEALRTALKSGSEEESIVASGLLSSSSQDVTTDAVTKYITHTIIQATPISLDDVSSFQLLVDLVNIDGAGNTDDFRMDVSIGTSVSQGRVATLYARELLPDADWGEAKASTGLLNITSAFLKQNGYTEIDRIFIEVWSRAAGSRTVRVIYNWQSVPTHTHPILRQIVNDTLTEIVADVYLDSVVSANKIGTVTLNAANNFRSTLAIGIGGAANQLPEEDGGNFHIVYVRPTSITGTTSGAATLRGQVDTKGELRF